MTRDELRESYLGHDAIRRFAAEMGVPVGVLKDVGDVGCSVGHAVQRVPEADRERAWKVAEQVLAEVAARHDDDGGEA